MSGVLAFIGAHKAGTALASVLLVVGATQVGAPDDRTATVTRIVDGDTLDVSYDGDTHRVRLLNIDTPETVHPDEPVECMGPEATAFLRRLLPQGTTVTLGYDDERTDRYGRELAGVFVKDQLVNAEIARAGLGAATIVGGNDRYYERVRQAQNEASAAGRGLFNEKVACTLPAQITAAQTSAETVSTAAAPVDEAGLAALEAEIAAVASRAEGLRSLVDGDDATLPLSPFRDDDRRGLDEGLRTVDVKVEVAQQRLSTARTAVEQRRQAEQAAREAAAKAAREAAEKAAREAAREAAERAAREAAEAAEAAAREASAKAARDAAAAEAARRARESAPKSSTSSSRSSSGGSSGSGGGSSGGYDGYTGCRAYGPNGTSIDEKGRRYTKISC